MISKFLVGQEVSGYTSKNHVFEGFVFKNKEGRKVVRNDEGKWLYLSELKKIKQVGRRLNEEYEEAITSVTGKLSADKLANKESEFENIAKDIATAAGVSESDSNRKDAEKFAHEQLVGLKAEKDASVSGNQAAMEKAKEDLKDIEKDPEEQAEESLKESMSVKITFEDSFAAKQFKDAMKKRFNYPETKSRYQVVSGHDENGRTVFVEGTLKQRYNKANDTKANLEEFAEENLQESKNQYDTNKKLFEDYKKRKAMREAYNETEDFDYADDMDLEVDDEFFDNEEFDEEPNEDSEVESFDDDLLDDDLLNDSEFDDYDDTVSDEFEAELDSYEDAGGDYTDDYLLEALAKKFGGDAQLALKESKGDKMNAVLHLANQVRKLREASAKSICSQVGQRLERVMKNPVNLDDFCGYLLNVGRTANSEQGIIIDDSAIGKVGQRLTTGEDISRFVITCCSYTTNPKAAVQFCKKYANQIGASILKGVKAGNANAALGQFDYASYLARLQA